MKKFRRNSSTMRTENNVISIPHLPSLKEQVVKAYGGKCKCCGEDQISCLQIDHIDGDGKDHRRKVKNVYADLRRRGYPPGVQVLCANCHQSKTIHGVCVLRHPNQTKETIE